MVTPEQYIKRLKQKIAVNYASEMLVMLLINVSKISVKCQ